MLSNRVPVAAVPSMSRMIGTPAAADGVLISSVSSVLAGVDAGRGSGEEPVVRQAVGVAVNTAGSITAVRRVRRPRAAGPGLRVVPTGTAGSGRDAG
ncbi:hypothetical protein ACFP5Z_01455, partial [Kocuria oceani]